MYSVELNIDNQRIQNTMNKTVIVSVSLLITGQQFFDVKYPCESRRYLFLYFKKAAVVEGTRLYKMTLLYGWYFSGGCAICYYFLRGVYSYN